MDITGLKAKAEADFQAAQEKYEASRSRALAAQAAEAAELENLAKMKAVLEWVEGQDRPAGHCPAAVRHANGNGATAAKMLFGKPAPEVAISDLCFEWLEKYGRSASTQQVRGGLAADGNEFTMTQVRGALKYLSSKKPPMVETTKGSGIWRLSKAAKAAKDDKMTSYTPTEIPVGVSMAGVNGSARQDGAVPPERD